MTPMKNGLQDKSGSVEHAGRGEIASGLLAPARHAQARDWRVVGTPASARFGIDVTQRKEAEAALERTNW
jgi:hypothetical protein